MCFVLVGHEYKRASVQTSTCKRILMVLHSDLLNVIASVSKFVSGSSNELRTNLSKLPFRFICSAIFLFSILGMGAVI